MRANLHIVSKPRYRRFGSFTDIKIPSNFKISDLSSIPNYPPYPITKLAASNNIP